MWVLIVTNWILGMKEIGQSFRVGETCLLKRNHKLNLRPEKNISILIILEEVDNSKLKTLEGLGV